MNSGAMRGDRLHIAVFGRRNAGKSSLINALTGQPVAIVSELPGTTTDPVYKGMEIAGIGPVVFIDTAGLDDVDEGLGAERKRRSAAVLAKTDLALLLVDITAGDFVFEEGLIRLLSQQKISWLLVANKSDQEPTPNARAWLSQRTHVPVSAISGSGIADLQRRIIDVAPSQWEPPFLRDLLSPMQVVVLVAPIDLSAPKGRLIMPQVKALRDALDAAAIPVLCKESELPAALAALKKKPALVVTDSQAFSQVAAHVPEDVPLTSFSILSIRQKGDLPRMAQAVRAVENLQPGDRVFIAEACTHHPLEDDIGRIKIPRWLQQHVGGELRFDTAVGVDFPKNLSGCKLIVHCGACTLNRREMLHRQEMAQAAGVPMTNYGVLIAFLKSVFPRALSPFPELYAQFSIGLGSGKAKKKKR